MKDKTEYSDEQGSLWSLTFVLLVIISLFTSMNGNGVSNGIVVLVEQEGGLASLSGIILAGFSFAALIFRFVAGDMSDTYGRKRVIFLGCVFLGSGCLLALCASELIVLVTTRILMGIGFSMVSTAAAAATADIIPQSRLGEGLGYQGMSVAIAMALGPTLSISLVKWQGGTALFGGFLALALISLVLTFFCRLTTPAIAKKAQACCSRLNADASFYSGGDTHDNAKEKGVMRFVEKRSLPASIIMALSCLSLSVYAMFVSLFAERYEIEGISAYFLIAASVMLMIRLLGGKILDKFSANTILVPSFLCGAAGLIVLALFHSSLVLYISGVLYGIFCGFQQPLLLTQGLRNVPENRRGVATGLVFASCDIGMGLGALLWGRITDLCGFLATLVGASVLLVVSLLLSLFLLRGK